MMETLPKPYGVAIDVDDDDVDILVNGVLNMNNLYPGKKYYTNTLGDILSSNIYYGMECSTSEAVAYIDLQADHQTIVSLESYVGTAISTKSIIVGLKN